MVSSKIGDGSAIQAKTSSSPKYQLCQTFGLEGETTQPLPSSLRSKPMAWRSQQPQPLLVVLRRGFNPIPRPFPSPGEGMQPLASARSVTKVSATHQRVAGRFLTQQSCDCWCSLRSPQCEKTIQLWFLSRLFVRASPAFALP